MEYKHIPWYEWLYGISTKGEVMNIRKWTLDTKKILRPWRFWTYSEYKWVTLSKNWITKTYLVHRLMLFTYGNLDITDSKSLVLHKDETLINWFLDNSLSNLYLGNHKTNALDTVRKNRHWSNRPKKPLYKRILKTLATKILIWIR